MNSERGETVNAAMVKKWILAQGIGMVESGQTYIADVDWMQAWLDQMDLKGITLVCQDCGEAFAEVVINFIQGER